MAEILVCECSLSRTKKYVLA